jgi:hypothetical protein
MNISEEVRNLPFVMIQNYEKKIRLSWEIQSLPWLILTDKNQIVTAEEFNIAELSEKV